MQSHTKINPVNCREIRISIGRVTLEGHFAIPEMSDSIVIFSHGSGSSRFSTRNNYVASVLNEFNIATLLTDLLTHEEDQHYENRFDMELLTNRLIYITRWVQSLNGFDKLPLGYFGASTGAASAINAAAFLKDEISAIVSRGGRPDLAKSSLQKITASTLLIVGSLDTEVIELNKTAFGKMSCIKKMEIVDGASHLFEEPGKLHAVSLLASNWFNKYLNKKPNAV